MEYEIDVFDIALYDTNGFFKTISLNVQIVTRLKLCNTNLLKWNSVYVTVFVVY